MASSTEICNLAISHLGSAKRIADLDTEKSTEANVCRVFYNTALEETLRDFSWPFATQFGTLSLVEEDPTSEWEYSYRYPSTCVKIERILSGVRNDTQGTRVPFIIARDDDGTVIYTDQEDAEVQYTYRETDPGRFSADFVIAFSYRLAHYIASVVTGGDPFGLGNKALQNYEMKRRKAEASAVNEEQTDLPVDSEFIQARL